MKAKIALLAAFATTLCTQAYSKECFQLKVLKDFAFINPWTPREAAEEAYRSEKHKVFLIDGGKTEHLPKKKVDYWRGRGIPIGSIEDMPLKPDAASRKYLVFVQGGVSYSFTKAFNSDVLLGSTEFSLKAGQTLQYCFTKRSREAHYHDRFVPNPERKRYQIWKAKQIFDASLVSFVEDYELVDRDLPNFLDIITVEYHKNVEDPNDSSLYQIYRSQEVRRRHTAVMVEGAFGPENVAFEWLPLS